MAKSHNREKGQFVFVQNGRDPDPVGGGEWWSCRPGCTTSGRRGGVGGWGGGGARLVGATGTSGLGVDGVHPRQTFRGYQSSGDS